MAKQHTDTQFNKDEFTRIFEEYRTKIEEITRSTERSLQSLQTPVPPAPETVEPETPAEQEHIPQDITPEPETEPASAPEPPAPPTAAVREDESEPTLKESDKILKQARKEAKQLLERAEEQARKEAKKKTQNQVDKLLSKAQKEAEDIVARAREVVERERAAASAATQEQLEGMLRDIADQYRQETQAQSSRLIDEARDKAETMLNDVIAGSADISHLVTESVNRAHNTLAEFESRLRADTEDITRAISEAQAKIEQINEAAREEAVPVMAAEEAPAAAQPGGTPVLAVRILGERSNGRNGTQPLFFGQVEMKADSDSFDYRYFKSVKKSLGRIPGIKHLQESATEKELSALFDITEPLPLLELLDNIPQVEEIINRSDRELSVVFKQA